jgi:hypothetical protein
MSKEQAEQFKDDLTDEEIAALEELDAQHVVDGDEPLFDPDKAFKPGQESNDTPDDDDEEEEEADPDANDPAIETPADKPDTKPADKPDDVPDIKPDDKDEKPEQAPEARKPVVPLLVAEAPEGYEDRIAAIAAEKEKLAEQFDDGDKTAKEYHTALDALNREERTLERSKDRYELAQQMEVQRQTNDRQAEINVFLASVGIPQDTADLRFSVLDRAVRMVASDAKMATATVSEIMTEAYDLCAKQGVLKPRDELGKSTPAPTKKDEPAVPAKKAPKKGPQTLAGIPQAEVVDTDANQFAHINRMQPDEAERAFERLSPTQQEAYLQYGS